MLQVYINTALLGTQIFDKMSSKCYRPFLYCTGFGNKSYVQELIRTHCYKIFTYLTIMFSLKKSFLRELNDKDEWFISYIKLSISCLDFKEIYLTKSLFKKNKSI